MPLHFRPNKKTNVPIPRPDDGSGHQANALANKWQGAKRSREDYEAFLTEKLCDPFYRRMQEMSKALIIWSGMSALMLTSATVVQGVVSWPIFKIFMPTFPLALFVVVEGFVLGIGSIIGEITPFHVLPRSGKQHLSDFSNVRAAILELYHTRSGPSRVGMILLWCAVAIGIVALFYEYYQISVTRVNLQIAAAELAPEAALESTIIPLVLLAFTLLFAIPGHLFPIWVLMTLIIRHYHFKYTRQVAAEQALEDSARELYTDHVRQIEHFNQELPSGKAPLLPVPANGALLALLRGNDPTDPDDTDFQNDVADDEPPVDMPPTDDSKGPKQEHQERDEDDLEALLNDSINTANLQP